MNTIKLSALLSDPRPWVRVSAHDVLSKKGDIDVPIMRNLHTNILTRIAGDPSALNMDCWHGDSPDDEYREEAFCKTTHCYCGWAEVYAGIEWFRLALQIGHGTTGCVLLGASFPEMKFPPEFYADHDEAMKHIEQWATFEQSQPSSKE